MLPPLTIKRIPVSFQNLDNETKSGYIELCGKAAFYCFIGGTAIDNIKTQALIKWNLNLSTSAAAVVSAKSSKTKLLNGPKLQRTQVSKLKIPTDDLRPDSYKTDGLRNKSSYRVQQKHR